MANPTPEMIQRGRGADPAEVERRRRASRELRAVREQLTSSTGLERAFDYELLRLFAETQRNAATAMLLLADRLGAAAGSGSPARVLLWMLVAVPSPPASTAARADAFLRLEAGREHPRLAAALRAVRRCVQGMSWSMLLTMLLQADRDTAATFLLFVALLVTAVTVMLSSNVPMAVYAGILPVTAVITGQSHASRSGIEWTTMVAMAVGGQLYFVVPWRTGSSPPPSPRWSSGPRRTR